MTDDQPTGPAPESAPSRARVYVVAGLAVLVVVAALVVWLATS